MHTDRVEGMTRRIIRVDAGVPSVALETRFDTEAQLHALVAARPEVLPTEDLRMSPLVPLANELDFGAGPMDLLAVDTTGRLVVIEFKRGSENPDVRKVVAQVLDYGSMLWRRTYEELEERCRSRQPGFEGSLEEHVQERFQALGENCEPGQFRNGVETCLDTGNFVFLYVGRDLDDRTRRIMTFLAEGARMTFFAVEIDLYGDPPSASVVVPRTAFVPSWIAGPDVGIRRPGAPPYDRANAPPEVAEMMDRMDELAPELGLRVIETRSGRNYHPAVPDRGVTYSMGVGVYGTKRGAEFNLLALREKGEDALADELLTELRDISGLPLKGKLFPAVPCELLVRDWDTTRRRVIEPYFRRRADGLTNQPVTLAPATDGPPR
jgi:hypothetical protein